MNKIVIVGSAGLGKEVKSILDAINAQSPTWELVGFYDDACSEPYEVTGGIRCLGVVNDIKDQQPPETSIVFGIAERNIVKTILENFSDRNYRYPNIIHPTVEICVGATVGIGNVFAYQTFISNDVSIGNFNFLNTFAAIGHDVTIGDFNAFNPRVQISGNVEIGSLNMFGMASAVVQNKTIGNKNIINSYSLLTKNIKDERKYFGIPARRIST
jgi:sugar O-acyltransferase (sialic acid O-acetyltransferase NeuD family)